jgi:hypothetical protein
MPSYVRTGTYPKEKTTDHSFPIYAAAKTPMIHAGASLPHAALSPFSAHRMKRI